MATITVHCGDYIDYIDIYDGGTDALIATAWHGSQDVVLEISNTVYLFASTSAPNALDEWEIAFDAGGAEKSTDNPYFYYNIFDDATISAHGTEGSSGGGGGTNEVTFYSLDPYIEYCRIRADSDSNQWHYYGDEPATYSFEDQIRFTAYELEGYTFSHWAYRIDGDETVYYTTDNSFYYYGPESITIWAESVEGGGFDPGGGGGGGGTTTSREISVCINDSYISEIQIRDANDWLLGIHYYGEAPLTLNVSGTVKIYAQAASGGKFSYWEYYVNNGGYQESTENPFTWSGDETIMLYAIGEERTVSPTGGNSLVWIYSGGWYTAQPWIYSGGWYPAGANTSEGNGW